MAFTCPKCSAEFYDRVKFCPECGFDFTAGLKRCPKCHHQVPIDSKMCPECGLDFERWSILLPRLILIGILAVVVLFALVWPWFWRSSPCLHDKAITKGGQVVSEVAGVPMVPLFIHWKTGERYIEKSAEQSGCYGSTDYMNNLIPLPPEVVFHYDMPMGEHVWVIRRTSGITQDWLLVGRWIKGPDKYGWIHESDVKVAD
jgi:predicted nucleic acid-binding Zn ribbon protein